MAEDLAALRKLYQGKLTSPMPASTYKVDVRPRAKPQQKKPAMKKPSTFQTIKNVVTAAPSGFKTLATMLPQMAVDYAQSHTPREVLSDVKSGLGSYADYWRRDPGGAAADLVPFIGDAKAVGEMTQEAQAARAAGNEELARQIESFILPVAALGILPEGGALAVKGARGAIKAARPAYNIAKEGAFTNVARKGVEREIKTAPEALTTKSMGALHRIAMNPERSSVPRVANEAAMAARGVPYDFNAPKPVSSLARQAGIGRAFDEAVAGSPEYKHALFERYGNLMPEVVEKAKAQNLDQLTEAAYNQLGEEAAQQFDRLPLRMRYHAGEGEYSSPNAMMQDVLGRGNLNVFSGGEPHEFLSKVDPATNLSQNEMFRAVHDYMGHVVPGSMFGAPGEEIAYAAHSQTLSPLAQLALLSETRGQNSWVNYSPANADIIREMNELKLRQKERSFAEDWLRRYPDDRWSADARAALEQLPTLDEMRARRHELGSQFVYAPQRAVLLPPEYLEPMSPGGTPDWLREIMDPRAASEARGVHFSKAQDLAQTDPSFYGTGAISRERPMVRREGLPDRTYFYSGPEGTVNPEVSVGRAGPHAYEADLQGLYDLQADPEGLVRLAKAYNLPDYQPMLPEMLAMNAGTEGRYSIPDIERLVRDYGYKGFITDMGNQRAAAMYEPVSGLRSIERGEKGYSSGGVV